LRQKFHFFDEMFWNLNQEVSWMFLLQRWRNWKPMKLFNVVCFVFLAFNSNFLFLKLTKLKT
jgi:hypothetical protein